MQRFKAALVNGNWPDNPEKLVRDDDGEYVKYEDVKELIKEYEQKIINAYEECSKLAEGWISDCREYQTNGNGNFWDSGTDYDQGRVDVADEIRNRFNVDRISKLKASIK